MFAVSAERTMAGAKPKFRDPEPMPVSVSAWREQRLQEEMVRLKHLSEEAIERGRQAAREFQGRDREPRFDEIRRRICRVLNITLHELRSERRHRRIVVARQAIAYWACRRTTLSLPAIGRKLGGFHHTTILHSKITYPLKRAKHGRYLREVL